MMPSAVALEQTVERLDQRVTKILAILTTALPRSLEGQLYITQSMIVTGVDRELRALELRYEIFPKIACEQISWTLLLVAYKHTVTNTPTSVTGLQSYALAPYSTALRYGNELERLGLLLREPDVNDGRRTWITATAETRRLMVRYFTALHIS